MQHTEIIGYPRLHFSLIDMAGSSERMYGGCGVSIKAFPVLVQVSPYKELLIETRGFVSERTKENLKAALKRAFEKNLPINCRLRINSSVKQHIGLGSSTQVILTALDAVSKHHCWNFSPEAIVDISGRGRTSLIGFATHYYGGFCIDA